MGAWVVYLRLTGNKVQDNKLLLRMDPGFYRRHPHLQVLSSVSYALQLAQAS